MIRKLQVKGTIKGFKRTPQRLSILEHLDGNTSHPSAEEIYRVVGKKNPSMSFATVYNTLNTLVQAGAVRELTIDPDRKRYDPDTSSHHHLICLDCKKVVDIPDSIAVEVPRGIARDFTITGNHIEFYGLCAPCRKLNRNS
ncbi:MAG: Fur family transcriptional regulator [Nitrospirota bacterium]